MREKLKRFIDEASDLLAAQGEFYSEGNQEALLDVLNHARRVYERTYAVPFTRNREFAAPRRDEDILFAIEHETMIPFGKTSKYGLKPALEWMKEQHILCGDLCRKAKKATSDAVTFLSELPLGDGIGEYDADLAGMARSALDDLQGKEGEELGKAVVRLQNAMRRLRHSRVLRAQTEPDSNLFFSAEGFRSFVQNVQKTEAMRSMLDQVKHLSAYYTPEQIRALRRCHREKICYDELKPYFKIWSKSENVINFVAPPEARFARILFMLPACENEEEGLGHVWVDDVQVYPENGSKWALKNPGFEEGGETPAHWEGAVQSGNPIFRMERRETILRTGTGAAYLENPTAADCGGFMNDEDIPISGGAVHTITFLSKIDGKLKKGLSVTVIFKDETGRECGRYESLFNRKSALTAKEFAMTAQADAILYALTGDVVYAQKAKDQLLFILDDFCQGMEYWMVYGLRPQGDDSYGAVQGGRVLSCFAGAYMLIKNSGVWTQEEWEEMMALLEYFVRNLLDLRDRTELTDEEVQRGNNNWALSMASGVGLLMLAMPDFPNAAQWRLNAERVLAAQMRILVNEDGSYPESIRYHHAALDWLAIYAKALVCCTGEDWFPALAPMFRFGLITQTPPYTYYDGKISTPNFGDHDLRPGKRFYLYGLYCRDVLRHEKKLAAFMYESWRKSGSPDVGMSPLGENIILLNFLFPKEGFRTEEARRQLVSSDELRAYGIYLFRKSFGREEESYCAILANAKPLGHGHYDQGSFLIYSHNVLMIADPGIEGYFDSSRDWYLSSSAHAALQFASKFGKREAHAIDVTKEQHLMTGYFSAQHGWTDTPRTSEVLDFRTSEELDEITIKIENPEGEGHHVRSISYYRNEEAYVIHDRVEGYRGRIRVSYPVAAVQYLLPQKGRVDLKGHYGVDAVIQFEQPEGIEISVEWGRCVAVCPPVDGEERLLYVRAETEKSEVVTRISFDA